MKFVLFTMEDTDTQQALYKVINGELILVADGDYYHDKIDIKIQGFFNGLDFMKAEYEKQIIDLDEILNSGNADRIYLCELETKELTKIWKDNN